MIPAQQAQQGPRLVPSSFSATFSLLHLFFKYVALWPPNDSCSSKYHIFTIKASKSGRERAVPHTSISFNKEKGLSQRPSADFLPFFGSKGVRCPSWDQSPIKGNKTVMTSFNCDSPPGAGGSATGDDSFSCLTVPFYSEFSEITLFQKYF